MKKRSLLIFSLIIFSSFLFANSSRAASFKNLDQLHLKSDEIISGNLYVVANSIIIDGKIAGDLIAAAKEIKINGEIAGDLIAMAPDIEIKGRIEGNSRIAFNSFKLSGYIGKNLNALGENINLVKDSFVGWDLLSSNMHSSLNGLVNGEADISSQNIYLNGEINKDLSINLEGKEPYLDISPEALVLGKFSYGAQEELEINNQDAFKAGLEFNKKSKRERNSKKTSTLIYSILSALAIASFLVYILKRMKERLVKEMQGFNNKDLLSALIFLILCPIVALIIFITIIGIPLSLLILLFYFLFIYLAKVVAAIFMAELMYNKVGKKKYYFLFLFLAIVGTWLIFSLPILGGFISTLATLFGLSILIKYVKNQSTNI